MPTWALWARSGAWRSWSGRVLRRLWSGFRPGFRWFGRSERKPGLAFRRRPGLGGLGGEEVLCVDAAEISCRSSRPRCTRWRCRGPRQLAARRRRTRPGTRRRQAPSARGRLLQGPRCRGSRWPATRARCPLVLRSTRQRRSPLARRRTAKRPRRERHDSNTSSMFKAGGARWALAMPISAGPTRLVPLSGARSCCHHAALKIKNPTAVAGDRVLTCTFW